MMVGFFFNELKKIHMKMNIELVNRSRVLMMLQNILRRFIIIEINVIY